jgi:hypothetical protein
LKEETKQSLAYIFKMGKEKRERERLEKMKQEKIEEM